MVEFIRIKGKVIATLATKTVPVGTHYENIRIENDQGQEEFIRNIGVP